MKYPWRRVLKYPWDSYIDVYVSKAIFLLFISNILSEKCLEKL